MTFKKNKKTCAVLGATGRVGVEMLGYLSDHQWIEVKVIAASPNSAGKTLKQVLLDKKIPDSNINALSESFLNMVLKDANQVEEIASQVDFVFSAIDLDKKAIITLEENYAKQELMVVSNNSACRGIDDVPLIIPEINSKHLEVLPALQKRLGIKKGGIVVKPNCSLQSYITIIDALRDLDPYDIVVTLLQSISGTGKYLADVPEIHGRMEGLSGEAEKSRKEPKKIFGKVVGDTIVPDEKINITVKSLRVPIEIGHTASVSFKLRQSHSREEIKQKLGEYNPLAKDNLPSSPNPVLHYLGDDTYPDVITDIYNQNGMEFTYGGLEYNEKEYRYHFIALTNNIGRGAAGGAVLTAELLIAKGLI